ncbi:flagellar hook-length control protein FliK [Methylomonas sp. AM2-LC]|uniref:flagellar hook-length control protein FliK n=1 Tax=Methylomonas sp. AM2-LC TaxID=3153301 RepID=UPI003266E172
MIQTTNPVSLVTGIDNSVTQSTNVGIDLSNTAAFTANLLEQLSLLQGNAGKNAVTDNTLLSNFQANNTTTDLSTIEQDLQSFAALFGKSTPLANKTDQSINLDNTLSALTDVLQYLQSLKTDGVNPLQSAQTNTLLNQSAITQNTSVEIPSLTTTNSSTSGSATNKKSLLSDQTDPNALAQALAITGQQIQQLQLTVPNSTVNSVSTDNTTGDDQQFAINQAVNSSTKSITQNDNRLAAAVSAATQQAALTQTAAKAQAISDVPLPSSVSSMLSGMSGSIVFSANQAVSNKKSTQTDTPLSNIVQTVSTPVAENSSLTTDPNTSNSATVNTLTEISNSTGVTQVDADSELTSLTQSFTTQNKSQQAANATDNMPINLIQPHQSVANTTHVNSMSGIALPLNHPNWNAELADKLQLMHKQDISTAELQINPPHLGPISIKIGLDQQDQTTISFTTQHQQVKEAIEASIPKLREMLGGEQLNLVDVNVSQQQSDQKPAQSFFQMASDQGKGNNTGSQNETENSTNSSAVDKVETSEIGSAHAGNGLLNLFA